jgi:uncharacterized protein YdiU (UPF0061 family)
MGRKLGLQSVRDRDAQLVSAWLQYLQDNELDYTLSHRRLALRIDAQDPPEFGRFEARWRERLQAQDMPVEKVRAGMQSVNPLYIPRNHLVQRAIDAAIDGDLSVFQALHGVLREPFDEQPGQEGYAEPPQPAERVTETFCGT